MKKVVTQYEGSFRGHCPVGSAYDDIYEYRMVNGHKMLVRTDDHTDCYELIQSYKLSTDINNILAHTTDIRGLACKLSQCIDTTQLPSSMQDFYNVKLRLTDAWRSLTAAQKAVFNNDIDYYIATLGGNLSFARDNRPTDKVENNDKEVNNNESDQRE